MNNTMSYQHRLNLACIQYERSAVINNQLFRLKLICIQHEESAAMWIYDACCWYVSSGRSSHEFDVAFCVLNEKQLAGMVNYCLKRDMSTDGIMHSIKAYCRVL